MTDWLYFIATFVAILFSGYVIVGALFAAVSWVRGRVRRPRLNPCPECGGAAVLTDDPKAVGVFVECPQCGTCTTPWATAEQAVRLWNRFRPLAKSRGA